MKVRITKIKSFRLHYVIIFSAAVIIFLISYRALKKDKKTNSAEIAKQYARDTFFIKDNLKNLPLLHFEAKKPLKDFFVIIIPGDGGWRDVIDDISKTLALKGINVIGFNTIPYFKDFKKPRQIAIDMQRIIRNFSHTWDIDKVVLVGYSFGAEILPFTYNQMDSFNKEKVIKIIMLGPSNMASFKVSPIYYYKVSESMPVLPEMTKIEVSKFIIFCDHYKETICKVLPSHYSYEIIKLKYGHLFLGHFKEISNIISERLIKLKAEDRLHP